MTDIQDAASTAVLRSGLAGTTMSVSDLWVSATGIGGAMRKADVTDITDGGRPATSAEHDILATALNDWFCDHGMDHPVALWEGLVPA